MRGEPPMRFVRVVSAEPGCAPNCPEWLSAEGRIGPGAATDLAEALERLNGRRLPILIHSPGGSVADAVAMGELIRAKGLAVAVARTLITNCPERAPKCPSGPGRAITGGAMCASACVLVLAGGVERLVGPAALVGVHQITTVVRETEGLAHLTSTRKVYEQLDADAAVSAYLAAMGVGDPVMALMRKTPAASVRWLSLADLKVSHLATLALDAAEPIATSGANGLNGRAFDGDPPPADLVQASAAMPFTSTTSAPGIRAVRAQELAALRHRVPLSARRRRGRSGDDGERCRDATGIRPALAELEPDADGARRRIAAIEHRRGAAGARDRSARALLRPRQRRKARRGAGPRRLAGRGSAGRRGRVHPCRNGRGEGAHCRSLSLSGAPKAARTDFQAGCNEFQAGRSKIKAGRNEIQIQRNKIQIRFPSSNQD